MSLLQKKQSSTAKQYKPVGDELSYGQLRLAKWYVRNKVRLGNIGRALLLVFCIGTVGYSTAGWIWYAAVGYQQDALMLRASVAQFQDYRAMQPLFEPEQPIVGSTTVLRTVADDRQDIVTEIRNPNTDWRLTVRYRYTGNDTVYEQEVLPTKRTLLAALGAPITGITPRLEVVDVQWNRISPHRVPDTQSFLRARGTFLLENIAIRTGQVSVELPSSVTFTVTNDTAYGYWEAPFFVVFYSGDTIVAVRPLTLERFTPGSVVPVQYNFTGENIRISDVELISTLDVFDTEEYLPVS